MEIPDACTVNTYTPLTLSLSRGNFAQIFFYFKTLIDRCFNAHVHGGNIYMYFLKYVAFNLLLKLWGMFPNFSI